MYILVVRKDKEIVFHKEYKTFNELMKKFENIDFDKEGLSYNIYKNMKISEILRDFLGSNDEMETIKNELKDLIKDL